MHRPDTMLRHPAILVDDFLKGAPLRHNAAGGR
jgi:hypothetical protein